MAGSLPYFPIAPHGLYQNGALAEGVYGQAVEHPELPLSRWHQLVRQKDWTYLSVATPDWFLALAVAHVGYATNTFVYLVDRHNPGSWWQKETLGPLSAGLTLAPSSLHGSTVWQSGTQRIALHFSAAACRVELSVQLPAAKGGSSSPGLQSVQADLTWTYGQPLALVSGLPTHLPAGQRTQGQVYTHKDAGMPVQGRLQVGDKAMQVDGLGTLDWTRAKALRTVTWKWASLAMATPQGRLGLNLSAEVYDDANGASLENAVWLNGQMFRLPGCRFVLPAHKETEAWRVVSQDDGAHVDLSFAPLGARSQQINAGLLRSSFVQPFGLFSGHIQVPGGPRVAVDNGLGVVEDHLSVW